METNSIHIFYACDDRFAPHLSASIASVLTHAQADDELRIYVMTKGMAKDVEQKIRSLGQIRPFALEIITVDDARFNHYKAPDYIGSSSTFYRYLIPDLKPDLDKVLYLDCDTVTKQSLRELFNTDLGNNYIAGVEDVHEALLLKKQKHEFDPREPYLNAGVLLFNCKQMRADNVTAALFAKSDTLEPRIYDAADQDVLNIVCKGKKYLLPLRYNVMSAVFNENQSATYSRTDYQQALSSPAIIHFTDRVKPWQPKGFPQNDLAYEYHRYLRLTPFYNKAFERKIISKNPKVTKAMIRLRKNHALALIGGLVLLPFQLFRLCVCLCHGKKYQKHFRDRTTM